MKTIPGYAVIAFLAMLPAVGCVSAPDPEPQTPPTVIHYTTPARPNVFTYDTPAERDAREKVRNDIERLMREHRYEEVLRYKVPDSLSEQARIAALEEFESLMKGPYGDTLADLLTRAMSERVTELLKTGDYEAVREFVWCFPLCTSRVLNSRMHEVGVNVIRTRVNPVDWLAQEKDIRGKVNSYWKDHAYDAARAYLKGLSHIRVYTVRIDSQLDNVCEALRALGLKDDKINPIATAARDMIAAVFVDANEELTETAVPGKKNAEAKKDLSAYNAELLEFRRVMVRYGVPEKDAEQISKTFADAVAPLIAACCQGNPTAPVIVEKVISSLGTTQVNVKIDRLREALQLENDSRSKAYELARLESAMKNGSFMEVMKLALAQSRPDIYLKALVAQVRAHIAANEWEAARTLIRDCQLFNDATIDARIYAVRIGLLNSEVNPAQLKDGKRSMLETFNGYAEKNDYNAACEWLLALEGVHDEYPQILAALKQTCAALNKLDAAYSMANAAKVDATGKMLRGLLDRRTGTYAEVRKFDFTELEQALAVLDGSIDRQMNGSTVGQSLRMEYLAYAKSYENVPPEELTTAELNAALLDYRDELLREAYMKMAAAKGDNSKSAYERLLEMMNKEVSFDSQIAIAEDALVRADGTAMLGLRPVLGDYLRAFRLLKKGGRLPGSVLPSLLIGAVYLDQPQVFKWARAMKVGADAVPERDSLQRTALLVAMQLGNVDMVRVASAAKASFDVADANGNTPLHYAVTNGNFDLVRLALTRNKANAANGMGRTALYTAVEKNQPALVQLLLKHGADATVKDGQELTLIEAAAAAGARDVLDILLGAKAPITDRALALAAAGNSINVARWLLDQGADVNAAGVLEVAEGPMRAFLIREGGSEIMLNARLAALRAKAEAEAEAKAEAEATVKLSAKAAFDLRAEADVTAQAE